MTEPITGATSSTFEVRPADVGRFLYCQVTLTGPGGTVTRNTNVVGPVTPGGDTNLPVDPPPDLEFVAAVGDGFTSEAQRSRALPAGVQPGDTLVAIGGATHTSTSIQAQWDAGPSINGVTFDTLVAKFTNSASTITGCVWTKILTAADIAHNSVTWRYDSVVYAAYKNLASLAVGAGEFSGTDVTTADPGSIFAPPVNGGHLGVLWLGFDGRSLTADSTGMTLAAAAFPAGRRAPGLWHRFQGDSPTDYDPGAVTINSATKWYWLPLVATSGTPSGDLGGGETQPPILATFDAATSVAFGNASSLDAQLDTEIGVGTWKAGLGELAIEPGSGNKYLRARYAPTSQGSARITRKHAITPSTEYYVSFKVWAESTFDWVKDGKLGPGLAGGTAPTGGTTSPNGFTCRPTWHAPAGTSSLNRWAMYLYWPEQPATFGSAFYLNDPSDAQNYWRWPALNQWVQWAIRVKMNTFSGGSWQANGEIQCWTDSVSRRTVTGLRFRNSSMSSEFSIDAMYFATFFGGNNSSFSPPGTQHLRFDDIKVSTSSAQVDGVT
jgi:hypothetical protein